MAARRANGPLYEEKLTMTMIVKHLCSALPIWICSDALYNSSVGDSGWMAFCSLQFLKGNFANIPSNRLQMSLQRQLIFRYFKTLSVVPFWARALDFSHGSTALYNLRLQGSAFPNSNRRNNKTKITLQPHLGQFTPTRVNLDPLIFDEAKKE